MAAITNSILFFLALAVVHVELEFQGNFSQITVSRMNWSDARAYCQNTPHCSDCDLADFEDERERKRLMRAFYTHGNGKRYFIGMRRDGEVWRWVRSGEPISPAFLIYTYDHTLRHECAELERLLYSSNVAVDISCDEPHYFACEGSFDNPCYPNPCAGRYGYCSTVNYQAMCENGETYDWCDLRGCDNGGSCLAQGAGFTCQCPPGYSGANCQIDLMSTKLTNASSTSIRVSSSSTGATPSTMTSSMTDTAKSSSTTDTSQRSTTKSSSTTDTLQSSSMPSIMSTSSPATATRANTAGSSDYLVRSILIAVIVFLLIIILGMLTIYFLRRKLSVRKPKLQQEPVQTSNKNTVVTWHKSHDPLLQVGENEENDLNMTQEISTDLCEDSNTVSSVYIIPTNLEQIASHSEEKTKPSSNGYTKLQEDVSDNDNSTG